MSSVEDEEVEEEVKVEEEESAKSRVCVTLMDSDISNVVSS